MQAAREGGEAVTRANLPPDAAQIPLIDVSVEPLPPEIPARQDIYLVVAYTKNMGWCLRRETAAHEFSSVDKARQHASALSAIWTHRCILYARLGGGE